MSAGKPAARARAHANIALVKYWGKRDALLNLPAVDSLSITLDALTTETSVAFDAALARDIYVRDGQARPEEAARVTALLDRFRALAGSKQFARIETHNDFPTGAGLASSASGFAAIALAAKQALALPMDDAELSTYARQGSGSAARSLFGGFVIMHRGTDADGRDSFAEPLHDARHWPLKVVIAITEEGRKPLGSTDGMSLTAETSPYYKEWLRTQDADIAQATTAVAQRDFESLAAVTEHSCLKMHASAMAAQPGIIYWNAATVSVIDRIRQLRRQGVPVCFTIDAGPQVKAICLPDAAARVEAALRELPGVHRTIVSGLGNAAEIIE